MKHTTAALLSVLILLAVLLCGASGPDISAEPETMDLQILSTSDLHGKFVPWDYALNQESASGSLTQLETLVKELRNDNTLLIDVGDTIEGNNHGIFLNSDTVPPMIAAQNAMNYDVWVTGNHEYNYGMDMLKKIIAMQKAKVLVGNVYNPDGSPIADDYVIFEKNGVKIGVIGMVTPRITLWDADNLADYIVTDPVLEIREIIDQIKDETDVLIAAVHMDFNDEGDTVHSGAASLAQECPELDLIVAAHGHSLIEEEVVNGVPIIENRDSAQTLSEVHLLLKKSENGWEVTGHTCKTHAVQSYAPDEELTAVLEDYDRFAREDASSVVGRVVGGDLFPENEIAGVPAALVQDTAALDLINDVCLYYSGADVSSIALLSLNSALPEGEIHKSDISLIYRFPNMLYTLQMTGAQLKDFMEWSARYYNQYQPGDLTVSFSPDIRYYCNYIFSGVNYEVNIANEVGNRIQNLTWPDGTPVKEDDTFVLATNNYCVNSILMPPGNVYEPDNMPILLERDVLATSIRDLILDYIIDIKGGIITPEVDNNWKIVGNDWDEALHQKAVEMLADGRLELPASADGRTLNVRSITEEDVKRAS